MSLRNVPAAIRADPGLFLDYISIHFPHDLFMRARSYCRGRAAAPIVGKMARTNAELENGIGNPIEKRSASLSTLKKVIGWIGYGLAGIALAACVGLLVGDAKIWTPHGWSVTAISAAPLLLIGVSFLIVQPILRPRMGELLKNMLLATTFLLWGVIQLMPRNALAGRLGNLVIVLYVVDLAWTTFASVNARSR